ncbi:hypothetical protein QUF90_03395 [Desulfococcaceae bacterium HSG9]|nr:hypothetical protein [Desulfococcaceae bacterium HSG9]
MQKKYIVRLTREERDHLHETIRKLKGSGRTMPDRSADFRSIPVAGQKRLKIFDRSSF